MSPIDRVECDTGTGVTTRCRDSRNFSRRFDSMTNYQRLITVRTAIESWVAGLEQDSSQPVDASIESESILIRDEFYCGHRLNTSTHRAVWFIEQDELKIYGPDGSLCGKLVGEQIDAAAASTNETTDAGATTADEASTDQPSILPIHQLDSIPSKAEPIAPNKASQTPNRRAA